MFSGIVKDILSIAQAALIPGIILFARSIRAQTELKRDIKEMKSYIILICEKQGIPCVLEKAGK